MMLRRGGRERRDVDAERGAIALAAARRDGDGAGVAHARDPAEVERAREQGRAQHAREMGAPLAPIEAWPAERPPRLARVGDHDAKLAQEALAGLRDLAALVVEH